MVKIVEFENVYLEYPDENELTDETKEVEKKDSEELDQDDNLVETNEIKQSRTTRLSLEELQQKLEETQTLHL